MKLFKTQKGITNAIAMIKTQGKALDKLLHETAVSIVAWCYKHGEVSLVNKIIDAMPKSARKNNMRAFFMTYAPVKYDNKTKTFELSKRKLDKAREDETVEATVKEAEQNPFYTDQFGKELEYRPFDLAADLLRLVNRHTKHLADSDITAKQREKDNISTELLAKLKADIPEELQEKLAA